MLPSVRLRVFVFALVLVPLLGAAAASPSRRSTPEGRLSPPDGARGYPAISVRVG